MQPNNAASPFRGNLVTYALIGLVVLLLVAVLLPNLAIALIIFVVALVALGSAASKAILSVPALRIATLRFMLAHLNKINESSDIHKFYLGLIGILGGKKPKLFSLQEALPRLPVPPLEETIPKFLRTVKPLLEDEEYTKTEAAANEFLHGVGPLLHNVLVQRANNPQILNWLEEWWEKYVYLQSREPLYLFSNWYGTDKTDVKVTPQLTRATNIISEILMFKHMIQTQELEPIRLAATVPFCMWQYSRLFGTARVPGVEQDSIVTYPIDQVKHIVILHAGQIWKMNVINEKGKPVSKAAIRCQLEEIKKKSQENPEEAVSIFTSQKRNVWADVRTRLLAEGNEKSIEVVEQALFVITLDDAELPALQDEANYACKHPYDRWFDKSFQITILPNGHLVVNVEHTWADAPVVVHMFDFICGVEDGLADEILEEIPNPPVPERLKWKLNDDLRSDLATAIAAAEALKDILEIRLLIHDAYGKGFIKQLKVSPDGFVQMALQLAYYNMYNKLVLTYESSHTRAFAHGRTETVRSASCEALEFVKAMKDKTLPAKEKLKLLRAAIEQHIKYMKECMAGHGVDRHLLGLYIVSKGIEGVETPNFFKEAGWQLKFKIASSQTPGIRTTGGGFAPMVLDGYGVSYLVSEEKLTFHLTKYKACPDTNIERFGEALTEALKQMKAISVVTTSMRRSLSQGELPTAQ